MKLAKSYRSKPTGWRYESTRHSLAAKGVKTRYAAVRSFGSSDSLQVNVGKQSDFPAPQKKEGGGAFAAGWKSFQPRSSLLRSVKGQTDEYQDEKTLDYVRASQRGVAREQAAVTRTAPEAARLSPAQVEQLTAARDAPFVLERKRATPGTIGVSTEIRELYAGSRDGFSKKVYSEMPDKRDVLARLQASVLDLRDSRKDDAKMFSQLDKVLGSAEVSKKVEAIVKVDRSLLRSNAAALKTGDDVRRRAAALGISPNVRDLSGREAAESVLRNRAQLLYADINKLTPEKKAELERDENYREFTRRFGGKS
jgi:hypothetical protein